MGSSFRYGLKEKKKSGFGGGSEIWPGAWWRFKGTAEVGKGFCWKELFQEGQQVLEFFGSETGRVFFVGEGDQAGKHLAG